MGASSAPARAASRGRRMDSAWVVASEAPSAAAWAVVTAPAWEEGKDATKGRWWEAASVAET